MTLGLFPLIAGSFFPVTVSIFPEFLIIVLEELFDIFVISPLLTIYTSLASSTIVTNQISPELSFSILQPFSSYISKSCILPLLTNDSFFMFFSFTPPSISA